MFLDYYGLREEPFGVTPDPRYLYLSSTHREALASLLYGVSVGRGFMALIARPGMGKTTLLFQLLQHFERSARTVFLFQTQSTPRDFLRSLLADLGVESDDGDLVRMHSQLNDVLLRESRSGKQFIVVIDEAQNLEDPVLEVVRMLSNFETSQEKLMQIILAGQPQLADKLGSSNLDQLRQRISLFGHLDPFDAAETNLYIDHRLCVAGHDFHAPLFTRQARALIASGSEGTPRNINNICFNALSLGCALKKKTIDRDVILEVLSDLDVGSLATKSPVDAKTEITPKHKAAPSASREKGQSALLGWLPRFAIVGAFLAALSWPLVDAVRNVSQVRISQNPTTVESASVGLTTQAVSGTPKTNFDAISAPRVIRVRPYETLYRICADNFGRCNTEIMQKIFELNPWMVNPDSLRPGQEIRIPATPTVTGDVDRQIDHSSNAPSAKAEKP
jgi:general secretion pathway protein A